jgi:hypothetical protein
MTGDACPTVAYPVLKLTVTSDWTLLNEHILRSKMCTCGL